MYLRESMSLFWVLGNFWVVREVKAEMADSGCKLQNPPLPLLLKSLSSSEVVDFLDFTLVLKSIVRKQMGLKPSFMIFVSMGNKKLQIARVNSKGYSKIRRGNAINLDQFRNLWCIEWSVTNYLFDWTTYQSCIPFSFNAFALVVKEA